VRVPINHPHRSRACRTRIVAHAPPRAFSVSFAGTGTLHIIEEGELVLRVDADPQASHLLASLPAVIILRGGRGQAPEGLRLVFGKLDDGVAEPAMFRTGSSSTWRNAKTEHEREGRPRVS
jgi:hypothetical protein